jgi:hypothetical protein
MIDRRVRRSSEPREALSIYLAAIARTQRLSALAVADGRGALVAGAGRDVHALAAATRDACHGVERPELDRLMDGEDMYARSFYVDGERLHVGTLGAPVRPFRETARSIARILRSGAEPAADAAR